jgi:outer membrane protein assembly factor BamA
VDSVYTPATLVGLGTTTTYVHSQATVGFDWRPAAAYARRGGFYGVTAHDYTDPDSRFGFRRVDYEVTQHFPILRESWVISVRSLASTTFGKEGQQAPFYLLPSLGGGSSLRGYSSWRFRDRNSPAAPGRMANHGQPLLRHRRVFYDSGKVAHRVSDLDFTGMKHDYGFGARFHTPLATVLRVDIARSSEGTSLVFGTSAAF